MHTCIPREIAVALPRNGLSVDVEAEAIELVVVEVGRGREVQDAEQSVSCRKFQTCRCALGNVEVGLIE